MLNLLQCTLPPQEAPLLFPFRALVRRDLRRTLRSVRPFLWLLLIVAIGATFVVAMWPGERDNYMRSAGMASIMLLATLSCTFFGAAVVLVPAYAAASIVQEREQDTYDQLGMTLIRPTGIVLGKLANVLGFYGLLLVACMPLLATSFLLVGLDWIGFLAAFVIVGVTALCCGCFGILCSAGMRSTKAAVVWSYIGMTFVTGFMSVPVMIVGDLANVRGLERLAEDWIEDWSPTGLLAELFDGRLQLADLYRVLPIHLVASVVFVLLAARYLRQSLQPVSEPGQGRCGRISLRGLLFGLRRPRYRPITGDQNPVAIRESRYDAKMRIGVRRRCFALLGAGHLLLMWLMCPDLIRHFDEDVVMAWVALHMCWIGVIVPHLVSTSLPTERDRNTLDLLRTTLLTPRQILLGKLWAAVRAYWGLLVIVAVPSLLFFVFVPFHAIEEAFGLLVTGLGSLFTCMCVALSTGLLASTFAKRSLNAVIVGTALTAAVFLIIALTPLFLGMVYYEMVGWQSMNHVDEEFFLGAAFFLSPALSYFYSVNELDPNYINAYWSMNVLSFLGLSVVMVRLAVARVNKPGRFDR